MELTVIVALTASVTALAHLAHADPKRRRAFGLPLYAKRRRTTITLVILLLPGVGLLALGDSAGFTIWIGGLTLLGWGIAAVRPKRNTARSG